MLIYVLTILVILLLIILFRYLPHRAFLFFVTLLVVLGGIVVHRLPHESPPPVLTPEERGGRRIRSRSQNWTATGRGTIRLSRMQRRGRVSWQSPMPASWISNAIRRNCARASTRMHRRRSSQIAFMIRLPPL